MTKMYIDYAVVKQALEALEDVDGPITALLGSLLGSPDADAPGAKVRTAITALRDALAQQAEPVEPVEPVAWIESPHGAIRANPNYKFTFPSQLLHWQIPLYTAPPQQVAQQAEPLNLSDPAVRKRLASQWGYVPAAAQAEPVAWMYKGEPWFDGTRYHDQYEVTTDERLAKFKDENARPLYFAP